MAGLQAKSDIFETTILTAGSYSAVHPFKSPAFVLTDGRRFIKATIRSIPLTDEYDGPGKCIVTGEPVGRRVVIAKAY